MTVRTLPGTPTLDAGVFWDTVATKEGWKIQYNKTLDKVPIINGYRVLDPEGTLWASADNLGELNSALPKLIDEKTNQEPLVDREMVGEAVKAILIALLKAANAAAAKTPSSK